MEKLNTEIVRVGKKSIDHEDLNAFEAVSMSVVAILALLAGTTYGNLLF
ncbi:MAG: hypothetical protein AAB360_03085 [Patescibacteria group bacterium]